MSDSFIFALNPKMLFVNATVLEIVLIILTSVVGIFAIAAGLERYMFRKLKFYEVIPLLAGGLLMIYPGTVTDIIGFAIVALIVAEQILGRKKKSDKVVL